MRRTKETAAASAAPAAVKAAPRKPAKAKAVAAPRKAAKARSAAATRKPVQAKPAAAKRTHLQAKPRKRAKAKPAAAQPKTALLTTAPLHKVTVATPTLEALRLKAATEKLAARRDRDRLPHRIETKRLVLRAPIRGDVPALVALADNKKIADMLSRLPSPYTRADAIGFVEIIAQRADERPYAITRDGIFLGIVGFTFVKDQLPEFGYWLGEPYWGQGLMSEAVAGALEAARITGAFAAVKARALATNNASLGVLEKAGFRRVGEAEELFGTAMRKVVSLVKEFRG